MCALQLARPLIALFSHASNGFRGTETEIGPKLCHLCVLSTIHIVYFETHGFETYIVRTL